MKRLCALAFLLSGPAFGASPAVEDLLSEYRAAGAGNFSAEQGRTLWNRQVAREGEQRSCATCHTADLRKPGKHATTGKVIDPVAPSLNAKRLTDRAEIEKWFGRNCKWTYGRACTPEEKGHFLTYMQMQ